MCGGGGGRGGQSMEWKFPFILYVSYSDVLPQLGDVLHHQVLARPGGLHHHQAGHLGGDINTRK